MISSSVPLLPNHRQHNMRRVHLVVNDRVHRALHPAIVIERLAGIRIDVESRKAAAADVHADAMSLLEDVAGGIELDREGIDIPGIHELFLNQAVPEAGADDAVCDVQVKS